jgi:hypothetical protein
MLVDVPIRVFTPPNKAPNERGIKNLEGLEPDLLAIPITTGIKIATTAVSLINAEIIPTIKSIENRPRR